VNVPLEPRLTASILVNAPGAEKTVWPMLASVTVIAAMVSFL
jgi:hypothetical protein